MSALEGASTSQDNDGGSEALITYMQSHSNPQVELFSASVLNEWLRSSEKARDDNSTIIVNYISTLDGSTE